MRENMIIWRNLAWKNMAYYILTVPAESAEI